MKKIAPFFLLGVLAVAPSSFAVDSGPEIFVTRYLGTGMEESFIVACPGTKSTCKMHGTTEGGPTQPIVIPRSKAVSLAAIFQGKTGDAVSEKKAATLPDPGHEKAAMGWRVRIDGKVSQGILDREEPTEAPAKVKYEKARKALLALETDLRALQDAQTPKSAKKKN